MPTAVAGHRGLSQAADACEAPAVSCLLRPDSRSTLISGLPGAGRSGSDLHDREEGQGRAPGA